MESATTFSIDLITILVVLLTKRHDVVDRRTSWAMSMKGIVTKRFIKMNEIKSIAIAMMNFSSWELFNINKFFETEKLPFPAKFSMVQ